MKPARFTLGKSALALLAVLTATLPARADMISLTATADAFVDSAQPTNNYGGAGALSIAAPGLPQGEFQSVLRFDSSAAVTQFNATYGAGNWSVDSAILRLTATAPNNAIFNASAAGQFQARWTQSDGWVEGTGTPGNPQPTGITFATLPSFLGPTDESLGVFSFPGGTSGARTYSLGLTPLFRSDIAAGGLVGLQLLAADSSISYLVDSRNFGTADARPMLIVTATPEPGGVAILIAFLAAGLRRGRS